MDFFKIKDLNILCCNCIVQFYYSLFCGKRIPFIETYKYSHIIELEKIVTFVILPTTTLLPSPLAQR